MGRRLRKYNNWIAGILALASLVFAAASIHDMQTAEGVGLYFALKLGADRLPFDLAADLAALLGLLLLTLLPCVFLCHRSLPGYFRMLTAFLAFMPTLSMAYLIHPFNREAIFQMEPLLFPLRTVAPFLCLLAAALCLGDNAAEGGSGSLGETVWRRWYGLCCLAAVLLALGAFCQPSLQPLFVFGLTYLLLIICFDLWERLYLRYPAMKLWGWLLFGGLELRAVYVLAEIMRKY